MNKNNEMVVTEKGLIDKKSWNEAIEVAARLAESKNTNTASSDQIRRLKK